MAGMEGVEPSSSLSCEREGLSVHIPFDSFLVYQLGESCQERTDALLLTRGQWFRGRTNPDRQITRLGILVSTLEADLPTTATSVARIPEGPLPGPIAARARLRASVPHVGTFHTRQGFSPPLRRSIGDRKELTPLSNHAFVRSMVRTLHHSRHQIEELASLNKSNSIYINKIKKCQYILA